MYDFLMKNVQILQNVLILPNCILLTFLVHKLSQTTIFLFLLYFIKIWWKSYINPKIPLIFFSDPCFYATVQRFRELDYVVLPHATVLGHSIKGLGKICFWLVRFIWERQMLAIITKNNKYLNCILYFLFNFCNQKLFVLILVNKNLE